MTPTFSGGKLHRVPGKSEQSSSLRERILQIIRKEGPISFARFMQMALYDPAEGYYSSGARRIGFEEADYFTSPVMSPVFGHTLARLMPIADEALSSPATFTIIELGAGSGETASQILSALKKNHPRLYARTRYVCMEQTEGSRPDSEHQPEWVKDISDLEPVRGVVFSNEFFDALPVHRVVMREDGLKEILVGERGNELVEVEEAPTDPAISKRLDDEGVGLAQSQAAEVCISSGQWMEKIASVLKRGLVLSIDYGGPTADVYSPLRKNGTVRTFHRHEVSEKFFENIGKRDITAHVDFSALARSGEKAGLVTLAFTDQLRLFLDLGVHEVFAELEAESDDYTHYQVSVQPAKALIMPGGMGETFKALLQSKGLDADEVGKLKKKINSKYRL